MFQLRECYATAVSSPITQTPEYKECFQILQFLSKDEVLSQIDRICNILSETSSNKSTIDFEILQKLKIYSVQIENASFQANEDEQQVQSVFNSPQISRAELKSKLLGMSKKEKKLSDFEIARNDFVQYMTKLFEEYLVPPSSMPFYEIFFYDNVVSLKSHVVGAPRAAIHTALNNPQHYLQVRKFLLHGPTVIWQPGCFFFLESLNLHMKSDCA